jgi:hypothetical protein
MIMDAWHRFRDGSLMSNGPRPGVQLVDRERSEAERRIAERAGMVRRQQELTRMARRVR